MPRFMPPERHAVCSAFGRLASTGPTSHAAGNNSAVLPRITARYSSSVVAVFLAAGSCITSPSAMVAPAAERLESGELFFLGGRVVFGRGELHPLALGVGGGGGKEDVERTQRADLDHHPER